MFHQGVLVNLPVLRHDHDAVLYGIVEPDGVRHHFVAVDPIPAREGVEEIHVVRGVATGYFNGVVIDDNAALMREERPVLRIPVLVDDVVDFHFSIQ